MGQGQQQGLVKVKVKVRGLQGLGEGCDGIGLG